MFSGNCEVPQSRGTCVTYRLSCYPRPLSSTDPGPSLTWTMGSRPVCPQFSMWPSREFLKPSYPSPAMHFQYMNCSLCTFFKSCLGVKLCMQKMTKLHWKFYSIACFWPFNRCFQVTNTSYIWARPRHGWVFLTQWHDGTHRHRRHHHGHPCVFQLAYNGNAISLKKDETSGGVHARHHVEQHYSEPFLPSSAWCMWAGTWHRVGYVFSLYHISFCFGQWKSDKLKVSANFFVKKVSKLTSKQNRAYTKEILEKPETLPGFCPTDGPTVCFQWGQKCSFVCQSSWLPTKRNRAGWPDCVLHLLTNWMSWILQRVTTKCVQVFGK